jgi:hypothetical protein
VHCSLGMHVSMCAGAPIHECSLAAAVEQSWIVQYSDSVY